MHFLSCILVNPLRNTIHCISIFSSTRYCLNMPKGDDDGCCHFDKKRECEIVQMAFPPAQLNFVSCWELRSSSLVKYGQIIHRIAQQKPTKSAQLLGQVKNRHNKMSNPCHDGSDLTNGPLYAVKLGTTPPTGRDDSRAKHLYMRLLSSLKGKMTQQFHIHLI